MPVVQADASIAKTFQTVSVSRVRTYVASDIADPWKAWIAVKGYNDLTSVDPANAYWAFVTVSHSFTVAGIIPSGLTITLQPGWNYVGFPSWRSQPYTVTNLKTAVPSITAVEGYANLGPYYLTRMADTDTLSQGSGYWVYSNTPNPVSWVVP